MQAPMPSPPATFEYWYMAARCVATIDGATLRVKQGLRNFVVDLTTARHLHIQATMAGQYLTLYLATEPTPGKKKVFRFLANANQPGFAALVERIVAYLPQGGDLRALDTKAALRTMGARDIDRLVGLITFALVLAGVVFGLSPKLVHGLDYGSQKLTVDDLGKATSLESRNVIITKARPLTGWTLAVTTVTKKNGIETGRSTKDYVPLVPRDWERGEKVHVILETKHDADVDEKQFRGIVRNVLWEGLDSKRREWFEKKIGAKLAADVVLVELRAEPQTDLYIFLGATLGTVLIGGLIAFAVTLKRKKKA